MRHERTRVGTSNPRAARSTLVIRNALSLIDNLEDDDDDVAAPAAAAATPSVTATLPIASKARPVAAATPATASTLPSRGRGARSTLLIRNALSLIDNLDDDDDDDQARTDGVPAAAAATKTASTPAATPAATPASAVSARAPPTTTTTVSATTTPTAAAAVPVSALTPAASRAVGAANVHEVRSALSIIDALDIDDDDNDDKRATTPARTTQSDRAVLQTSTTAAAAVAVADDDDDDASSDIEMRVMDESTDDEHDNGTDAVHEYMMSVRRATDAHDAVSVSVLRVVCA
jgi:hypothetical protein